MLTIGINSRDIQFEVYPNPIEEEILIQVQDENSNRLELKLMDSNGRILLLSQPEENSKTVFIKSPLNV